MGWRGDASRDAETRGGTGRDNESLGGGATETWGGGATEPLGGGATETWGGGATQDAMLSDGPGEMDLAEEEAAALDMPACLAGGLPYCRTMHVNRSAASVCLCVCVSVCLCVCVSVCVYRPHTRVAIFRRALDVLDQGAALGRLREALGSTA